MLKFFRHKGTEIRKVALVDEAGKEVVAIIGQVDEMVSMGLLEPIPGINDRAYVAIETRIVNAAERSGVMVELKLKEYDTLEEAKEYIKEQYGGAGGA